MEGTKSAESYAFQLSHRFVRSPHSLKSSYEAGTPTLLEFIDAQFPDWESSPDYGAVHRTDPGRSPFACGAPIYEYIQKYEPEYVGITKDVEKNQEVEFARLLDLIKDTSLTWLAYDAIGCRAYYILHENAEPLPEVKYPYDNGYLVFPDWARLAAYRWIALNMPVLEYEDIPVMYDFIRRFPDWERLLHSIVYRADPLVSPYANGAPLYEYIHMCYPNYVSIIADKQTVCNTAIAEILECLTDIKSIDLAHKAIADKADYVFHKYPGNHECTKWAINAAYIWTYTCVEWSEPPKTKSLAEVVATYQDWYIIDDKYVVNKMSPEKSPWERKAPCYQHALQDTPDVLDYLIEKKCDNQNNLVKDFKNQLNGVNSKEEGRDVIDARFNLLHHHLCSHRHQYANESALFGQMQDDLEWVKRAMYAYVDNKSRD